jgi:hypothetical protein
MHGVNYLRNYFKNTVYHRDCDVLIELNTKMSITLTVEAQIPFKLIGFTIDNRINLLAILGRLGYSDLLHPRKMHFAIKVNSYGT